MQHLYVFRTCAHAHSLVLIHTKQKQIQRLFFWSNMANLCLLSIYGCLCCFQVLEAGDIMRLEPQLSSLQHLTRLKVIDGDDDEAGAAALQALRFTRAQADRQSA